MIKKYFNRSPFVAFLPFLLLYFLIVLILHKDTMEGDEARYYHYAQNLLAGFYSSPPPNINLWSGPGYSIILMPFVFFKLPLITITLLNAVLYYLSVVLLFLSLKRYTSHIISIFFSVFFAVYYPAYEEMFLIYTESLTLFLFSSIVYFFTLAFHKGSKKALYIAGILTGFLVLTKVILGYVLLLCLLGSMGYFLIYRSINAKRLFLCTLIAFAINLPYLFYTYHLTNKPFYWANSGGVTLYWMSTPHKGEFGDWHSENLDADCGNEANPDILPCANDIFKKVHGKDMEYVARFPPLQKDSVYKDMAIANIRAHPSKFLANCISNIGRLFFNYPYTYTYQKNTSLYRLPACCIMFVFFIFSIIATLINWRKFPFEIRALLLFIVGYIGISIIVSAYSRQLSVIIPVLSFWFGYVFHKTVKIKLSASGF